MQIFCLYSIKWNNENFHFKTNFGYRLLYMVNNLKSVIQVLVNICVSIQRHEDEYHCAIEQFIGNNF